LFTAFRPQQIRDITLSDRETVWCEHDEAFFLDVTCTKDRRFVVVNSNSKLTSEVRLFDSARSLGRVLWTRSQGVRYFVESLAGSCPTKDDTVRLLVASNIQSPEGDLQLYTVCAPSLSELPPPTAHKTAMSPVMPNYEAKNNGADEPANTLADLDVFASCVALYEHREAQPRLRLLFQEENGLPAPAFRSLNITAGLGLAGHALNPGSNRYFFTDKLRFSVSSPVRSGVYTR
jgi:protease II